MSNKKRIRKKIAKPYEAKFRRAVATIARLIIEQAFLKSQLAIVACQKVTPYPKGGFIEGTNEDGAEKILLSNGDKKNITEVNFGWEVENKAIKSWNKHFENLKNAIDK